jgi:hypothetical protein
MRDQFSHFYAYDEDAIATAMRTGLVVPDTNVLLSMYRLQARARDELFGALEKVSDRLWVPHQVGLEFHRNRLNVMKDQEGYFAKTKDEFDKSIKGFGENVQAFKRRLSLDDGHVEKIRDALANLGELVADAVSKASELSEVRLKDHALDPVRDRIDVLFDNRVGSPMEPGELEEARKEADRRGNDGIPPGYKDKDKTKGDPAGDYLVWRQLITEAKTRNLPVVFVTDDTKEDWYQREQGLTLGARRELREEMKREVGVSLLMMTTETFLRHAKTYLNAEVSPETVDQAKELPGTALLIESPLVSGPRRLDALHDLSVTLDRVNRNRRGGAYVDANLARHWLADRSVLDSALADWTLRELDRDPGAWQKLFAWALQVPPDGAPRDIRDAEAVILNYVTSGDATDEQMNQARVWVLALLRERPRRQGQEPQDESPAEG